LQEPIANILVRVHTWDIPSKRSKTTMITENDRNVIQAQLDFLSTSSPDLIPDWAWVGACSSFEKMWGLPDGFFCATNFPDLNKRGRTVAFDDFVQAVSSIAIE
jgi:hypothetical protein